MNGPLIAFIAQVFIGTSLIFDKIILKNKATAATLTYIFWIGILEGTAIFLAPFGFRFPPPKIILLSLFVGVIYLAAIFFYYLALKFGEASQSLAIVGGFTPIATLLFGNLLLSSGLNIAQKIAFGFLVGGGLVLFLSEKINFKKILPWMLLSSVLFGLSNVLNKIVFNNTNFISGFVTLKAGTMIAALSLLLIPVWKEKIVLRAKIAPLAHKYSYFGNRILAATGSILFFYAISLSHPALVDGIGSFRYIVIFLIAFFFTKFKPSWLAEKFDASTLAMKIAATCLVVVGLAGLGLQSYYENQAIPSPPSISWGVTFSSLASKELGLDWRENFSAILKDLKPQSVRIAAYWDSIEQKPGGFDFSELDWQMRRAEDARVPVILVVGQKTPRWPECHYPQWLLREFPGSNSQFPNKGYENELLNYLSATVRRYKNSPTLLYWQVENEPFLLFGECPPPDAKLLDEEISLVKSADPAHEILLTDGGEFGDWYRAAKRGDIFGTTLYRTVYNKIFGHITYPLTPEFYRLKTAVVKFITGRPQEKFIVIELGLEPWTKRQIYEITPQEQLQLFNISNFSDTIKYAERSGFDIFYLWGAEWWYFMKQKQNHPEFWEAARAVIWQRD